MNDEQNGNLDQAEETPAHAEPVEVTSEVTHDTQPDSSNETYAEADSEAAAEPGLLDIMYGMMADPVKTNRLLIRKKPVLLAFLVTIVIALVSSLPNLFTYDIDPLAPVLGSTSEPAIDMRLITIVILIFTPVTAGLTLLMQALLYHAIGSILRNSERFKSLISAFGFNAVPLIFMVPLSVLLLTENIAASILYGVGLLALTVWVSILNIIAIRENYEISTGKAVLAYLLPIFALFVLLTVFIVAIVAIAVSALSSS